MKSLFLSIVLCLGIIAPAHAIIGNIGHSTSLDFAKTVVPESVEKLFINVKASAVIAAGKVAALDLTADDGATVLVTPVTGLAPLCVMVNACAVGELCKCQTYGLFEAALFDVGDGNAVAGHKGVMSSGNAGYVAARATDLATDVGVGYFYDAASASGSVQLFIKL